MPKDDDRGNEEKRSSDVDAVLNRFESGYSNLSSEKAFADVAVCLKEIDRLQSENERLQSENERLQAQVARLTEALDEIAHPAQGYEAKAKRGRRTKRPICCHAL